MEVGGGCGGRASGGLRGRIDFVLNYRVGEEEGMEVDEDGGSLGEGGGKVNY